MLLVAGVLSFYVPCSRTAPFKLSCANACKAGSNVAGMFSCTCLRTCVCVCLPFRINAANMSEKCAHSKST